LINGFIKLLIKHIMSSKERGYYMKKKLLTTILSLSLGVSLLAGLAGCSSAAASTTKAAASAQTTAAEATIADATTAAAGGAETTKANADITVAYVTGALTTQIFRDQVQALQAYSDQIGIKFLYTAEEETSAQITACENYISMGVDVLMVHVGDAQTFTDIMKEAQAAGVKWFSYDTNIEGSDAYYGWKNYDLGYAIGKNASEWVNKTFTADETIYAASNNYPSLPFLIEREQGYKDAINELCKCKVEWVTEAVGGTTDNGVTAGENYLQCGYKLNLVVGINDSGLVGVYQAFDAAGYGNDKVAIFGCDSDPEALDAIAADTIYRGTVNTGLVKLAPDFINICVDLANGKEGGEHWGDFTAITIDNVADFQ